MIDEESKKELEKLEKEVKDMKDDIDIDENLLDEFYTDLNKLKEKLNKEYENQTRIHLAGRLSARTQSEN